VTVIIAVFQTLSVMLGMLKDCQIIQIRTVNFVKWLIFVLVSLLLAFGFGIETWSIVWTTI
jgi:hypothetical protein